MITYMSMKELCIRSEIGITEYKNILSDRLKSLRNIGLHGIDNIDIMYNHNDDIVKQLSIISELYKRVKNSGNKESILIDSFDSATIEGAKTTIENVKKSFNGRVKSKDDKMVINSVKGMKFALNNKIDYINISKLWKTVVDGVCENTEAQKDSKFRTKNVYVGSYTRIVHKPEEPSKITIRMKQMFRFIEESDIDVWIRAIIVHFYFVYIHPMCDGNGRTARIIMSSVLNNYGLDKVRYLQISSVINQNLSSYYKSIKDSEYVNNNMIDITPFIVYMLNCIERAMVYNIVNSSKIGEHDKKILARMRKRGSGTEITVKKCSRIIGKSESYSRMILNELVDKGLLIKYKSNNKNIYVLK